MLGVHAVVRGERDGAAERVQAREIAVHHGVERIGRRRARRGLVLHVVGGREVHQIRAIALHQLHARGKHEFRQLRAVHRRHRHADERDGRRIRLLRGEAGALQLVPEERAQLVLRRDHRHLRARVRERRQQRAAAQVLRVVHHHLGAGVAVKEVVAADAMHRRRRAGDDRQVVRIGEGRNDAVGVEHRAVRRQAREERRDAGANGLRYVGRLAAVDADHHQRSIHPAVGPAVGADCLISLI